MCKQDISVTQILREIYCEESKGFKNDVFAISLALNFVDLVNFNLQKVQNLKKFKIDFT